MNILKKLLCVASLSFGMESIYARQKESITIKNEFGASVLVNIEFQSKIGLHMHSEQNEILKKNETQTITADSFHDTLYKIYTAPTIALTGNALGDLGYVVSNLTTAGIIMAHGSSLATVAGGALASLGALSAGMIATEILKSQNNASRKAHGHKFFVISHNSKKSKLAGTKQIVITGYPSEAAYNQIKKIQKIAQSQASESQEK